MRDDLTQYLHDSERIMASEMAKLRKESDMSDRGGATNSSTPTFGTVSKGNPEGRGGSTNDPKGATSDRALGTQSTNPTSKTGKPTGSTGPS